MVTSTPEPSSTSNNNPSDEPVRWAGVDWSWSEHAVCVIDETGGAIARFTVRHTAAGLSRLVSVLQDHRVTAAPTRPALVRLRRRGRQLARH